ncbi:phosphatase PAP2 family protein [Sphingomonas donggukensis]|uniref:Phosphatase PAP2 family protein n=1 Tax=Sphingomonas donggukensis TaxID=2949093 RepID=A0ABY4TR70_9SPHN|nr:phosphatase PAP2 family protein [Sphingomonas donggukensis]URW74722.1 phosphatase PAP2 family protein [Sphingomonas donggukensis]
MTEDPAHLIDIAEQPVRTRRPPWLLVAGAALAAALWALIHLASEVREGEVLSFDRTLMLAMRTPGNPAVPLGGPGLASAMRDMTALGGGPVLTMVVVLVAVFLLLKRQYRPAALVVVATASGGVAISVAKWFFARARPDLVDHMVAVASKSFPSGHAGNSAIVYLTLASLLFPVIREARLRVFVVAVALLLVGAIGVSRVYLGVHWPSDVLAGWLFGALWALGWWAVEARVLGR